MNYNSPENFTFASAPQTYPNQRTVIVHREPAKSDFLGIKNEHWQAAARNLRPHALLLYLYIASNRDNFRLALSPAAIQDAIGMPRSTYHDQFHALVSKGYLVQKQGNTYEFYEVPCPRAGIQRSHEECELLGTGLNLDDYTADGIDFAADGYIVGSPNTEINNKYIEKQNGINNNENVIPKEQKSLIPEVKEIRIKRPTATPKIDLTAYKLPEKKEFVF